MKVHDLVVLDCENSKLFLKHIIMSWQNKISVGLYRIALVVSVFCSIITFLLFFQTGIGYAILAALVAFVISFGVVALINWILRGFVG